MTAVELYNERFRDLIGASFRNLGEEEASTSSSKTESDVEKPIRVADGQVTGCESVRSLSLSFPLTHPQTKTKNTGPRTITRRDSSRAATCQDATKSQRDENEQGEQSIALYLYTQRENEKVERGHG